MSLAINVEKITAVKIGEEWHRCAEGSFDLDAYELYAPPDTYEPALDYELKGGANASPEEIARRAYRWNLEHREWLHQGGQSGVCATGFSFHEVDEHNEITGDTIAGPLTAITALRYA